MSTNFSTIAPLSASTISRAPSFVKEGAAETKAEPKAEQPVASSKAGKKLLNTGIPVTTG